MAGGRPEKPIDWDLVDKLLEAGCLGTEIAANFDMHPNTFYDKVLEERKLGFTEYSRQKKSKGESILRAVQFQSAIKDRDRSMLIWLGKQRLNQREPDKASLSEQDAQTIVKAIYYADKKPPDSDSNPKLEAPTPKNNPKRTLKKKKRT